MPIDALLLSRPSLGAPIVLQIVLASFAVGLASYVVVLEGLWLATRTPAFRKLRGLWLRIFLFVLAATLVGAAAVAVQGVLPPMAQAAIRAFPYRAAELAVSAFLGTALAVGALSSWTLLKDPTDEESSVALRMAIGMFVICAPLEVAFGDGLTPRPREMVALAAAAAFLGLWGAMLAWRSAPERSRAFLAACLLMGPVGLAAPLGEWLGAEASLPL